MIVIVALLFFLGMLTGAAIAMVTTDLADLPWRRRYQELSAEHDQLLRQYIKLDDERDFERKLSG